MAVSSGQATAGQRSSQAFQLAEALRQVVARHYPDIKIEVFETRGSLHNAKLLDEGAVQLATVQADQAAGADARMVANLYPDTFQIVVRGDSGINQISDLIGKRIALPPKRSGEYEAFWFLANYYSLTENNLKAFMGTERTTDWLLINGDVEALFPYSGARRCVDLEIDQGGQRQDYSHPTSGRAATEASRA